MYPLKGSHAVLGFFLSITQHHKNTTDQVCSLGYYSKAVEICSRIL